MNHVPASPDRRRRCARTDLADEIIRWDELPRPRRLELETHAATCAACGPALALVRRADAWLAAQSGSGDCPSADELFDFGRGPGARSLSAERHAAVELHVHGCEECRGFVDTLAAKPPVPLIITAPRPARAAAVSDEPVAPAAPPLARTPVGEPRVAPESSAGPRSVARPTRRPWRALAAAAVVLVSLGLLWRVLDRAEVGTTAADRGLFPPEDVLRGDIDDPLLSPRGALVALDGRAWHDFVFAVAPRERAEAYRFVVRRYGDDPLAPGVEIARWTFAAATSTRPAEAFGPGRYAWEAWAVVDGLDLRLGARDFEVREDAAFAAELSRALVKTGDERTRDVLWLLHREGYLDDARAFARELPPSAERDAYLARPPGR